MKNSGRFVLCVFAIVAVIALGLISLRIYLVKNFDCVKIGPSVVGKVYMRNACLKWVKKSDH